MLPFFGSRFLPRKKFICSKKIKPWRLFSKPSRLDSENFKKKSSRDDFLKTIETRRKFTLKSLYFWNRVSTVLKKPSRLDFFLKFSDRVKSLSESYSRMCPCADHCCARVLQRAGICDNIVQWKLPLSISLFLLRRILFCDFLEPLVSEFGGGSEFLTGCWFWKWFFIQVIDTDISRRQVL